MAPDPQNPVQIKIRSGRAVTITAPCVLILPENSRLSAVFLHAILMGDGEIHHHRAPIDDRPRKAR